MAMAHCPEFPEFLVALPTTDIRDGEQCPQESPTPWGLVPSSLANFFQVATPHKATLNPVSSPPEQPRTPPAAVKSEPSYIKEKAEIYPEVVNRIPELSRTGQPYSHGDVQVHILPMDSLADDYADHWNQGSSLPRAAPLSGKGNHQKFHMYSPGSSAFFCSETLQFLPPSDKPQPWVFVSGNKFTATLQAVEKDRVHQAKIRWEGGALKLEAPAEAETVVQLYIKAQKAALTREVCKQREKYFFYLHDGVGKIVAMMPILEQLAQLERSSQVSFETRVKELTLAMAAGSLISEASAADLATALGKLRLASPPVAVAEPCVNQTPAQLSWADDDGVVNFNDNSWMYR